MPSYRVTPTNPAAHLFTVELTVDQPDPDGQVLSLPAWIPGSYLVREFSKNIVTLHAWCGDAAVAVTKRDKHTWCVAPCAGPLRVVYTVYAWDLSVRMAHLDQTHGYFNGTSMFLRVHGQDAGPQHVELVAPSDPLCEGWRVATTLPEAPGTARYGFGAYVAPDYDALIDHPVELGTWSLLTFEACGVPHEVAFTGVVFDLDEARLIDDLTRICTHQIQMFGEPAPMDRYLFQVMVVGSGYGGLEHRASTSLICKRDDLPRLGDDKVSDGYRQFLGLCSHEYFHTWNVKRIKPAAFTPYDLSTENYTVLLWAFEGITSYYDDLILLRTGCIDVDSWLELVGRTLTRVRRGSGRLKQSLSDSSWDAWTKFYRQDENATNAIVSYYAKGSLAALGLDLTLRKRTDGRVSLDDVMRALWVQHGQPGVGVPERGIQAVAEAVSGLDLQDYFDLAVRGTEDIPLESMLAEVGVILRTRAAKDSADKGGTPGKGDLDRRGDVGAVFSGARIKAVRDGGAAQAAGLSAGDVVVAIDGIKAGKAEAQLGRKAPGSTARVHVFRRDELLVRDVTLGAPAQTTVWLELADDHADARAAWLQAAD